MSIPEQVKAITGTTSGKTRFTQNPASVLAATAIEAVLSKKADDVVLMNMTDISGIADYFLICTGSSDAQIKAIANAVRDEIKDNCGERAWHVEGMDSLQWVLLDYVDVVVHVMTDERRAFYSLERLWGDADTESIGPDASVDDIRMLAGKRTTPDAPPIAPAEGEA